MELCHLKASMHIGSKHEGNVDNVHLQHGDPVAQHLETPVVRPDVFPDQTIASHAPKLPTLPRSIDAQLLERAVPLRLGSAIPAHLEDSEHVDNLKKQPVRYLGMKDGNVALVESKKGSLAATLASLSAYVRHNNLSDEQLNNLSAHVHNAYESQDGSGRGLWNSIRRIFSSDYAAHRDAIDNAYRDFEATVNGKFTPPDEHAEFEPLPKRVETPRRETVETVSAKIAAVQRQMIAVWSDRTLEHYQREERAHQLQEESKRLMAQRDKMTR
jgi:hypothetical protein